MDDVDSLNDVNDLNREFRFAATQSQGDNGDYFTRSAAADEQADEQADEAPQMAIYDVEGDEELEKPLYLHMTSEKRPAPTAEEVCADETITRGAPVTSASDFINMHQKRGFGLFTYVYKPGTWNASTTTSEYMHNIPIVYWSSAKYWAANSPTGKTQYHWPGENYKVRFYAYAPAIGVFYDHEESADKPMTIQETAFSGTPTITYCVTEHNTEVETDDNSTSTAENLPTHADLLYAKSAEYAGNHNQTVSLSFIHALTAVRFNIGAGMVPGTIKSIVFQNVYREGVLNLDKTTNAWSGLTTKGTVKLVKDIAIEGTEGEYILPEEDYFMMMPQTLPSDATCTITFVDYNGKSHTLTGNISGQKWNMGDLVTYTITPEDVLAVSTFTVTDPGTSTFTYQGGWTPFYVTSYLSRTDRFSNETTIEAAPWVVEFWNGSAWVTTRPDIFSTFTPKGNGGDETKYGFTVAPQKPVYQNNPLAGVAAVGTSDEPHDLSNPTGAEMNTANCYIVNAPGVYILPLVYGNGVEKNECNFKAINPGGAGTSTYPKFVNHHDAIMGGMFIEQLNNTTAKDAILVYSDEVDLVKVRTDFVVKRITIKNQSNAAWSTNVKYLQFEVPAENIMPGNAIVAVRDTEGKIAWSWHIWVTDFNPYAAGSTTALPTVKDSSGKSYTYDLMNKNLGWCPAKTVTWAARSAKYRIRQVATGETKEFTINQSAYGPETRTGNCPYYQWGRKDPMLSFCYANGSTAQEKPCYTSLDKDPSGASYAFRIDEAKVGTTMGVAIQNPHVYYPRSEVEYDWCTSPTNIELNRWDGTNTLGPKTLINGSYGNKFSVNNDFEVQKTVYDPSPVGFCMPPKCAFRGLDYDLSGATGSYETIDGSGMFTIENIKFPTTGDRSRTTGASWYDASGKLGEYWTSSPVYGRDQSVTDGEWSTKFESATFLQTGTKTASLGDIGKSSGFAVRCIKQK